MCQTLTARMWRSPQYPTALDAGGCWYVHTLATLAHNAGGDSVGITPTTLRARDLG